MKFPFFLPCALFFLASCGESDRLKTVSSEDCYEAQVPFTEEITGEWYGIGMVYGRANIVDCFDIDTTGYANNHYAGTWTFNPDSTARSQHGDYGSNSKCYLDATKTKLIEIGNDGDNRGDTMLFEVALLTREYLVIVRPDDPAKYKSEQPISYLYMRR